MKHTAAALVFAALATLPVAAQATDLTRVLPAREEWQALAEAMLDGNQRAAEDLDPLLAPMELCEERGCTGTGWQALSEEEAAQLRALFADGSAAEERRSLGQAIALLETFMGMRNGTWRDHAANTREYENEPGQMDCVAESINTRTYLTRLSQAGLLRQHQVGGFIHRYTVVLQHVAVDIVENGSDERFAVDSWVGANGEEPDILPYGDWRWQWAV